MLVLKKRTGSIRESALMTEEDKSYVGNRKRWTLRRDDRCD